MKLQVAYKDGTFGEIPGVNYHPRHERRVDQFDAVADSGGLWITADRLFEHLALVNKRRRANGIEERVLPAPIGCVDLIDFASAPLEVYIPTDDGAPWKHGGTFVKTIPYGGDDSFWNNH